MTDHHLLDSLHDVLVAEREPPVARVAQLRRLVIDMAPAPQAASTVATANGNADTAGSTSRLSTGWASFQRVMAVPVLAIAGLLGMTGVAFALGPRTPIAAAVRNVAHDVGLPVESARLIGARAAVARLQQALSRGDNEGAARQAKALKQRLTRLHPDEQQKVPEAVPLLQQALPATASTGDPALAPDAGAAPVTVIIPGIEQLVLAPSQPSMVAGVGEAFAVNRIDAKGRDLGSVDGAVLTISPDGSCSAMTCSATSAGPHVVIVSARSLLGRAAVTVVPGALDHVALSPEYPTVTAGTPQSFTVRGFDAYGNDAGDVTTSTSLAIAPDGSCTGATCTATTAGLHTVTPTSGPSARPISLVVTAGPLDRLAVSPPAASIVAGDTQPFTIAGFDAFGNQLGDLTAG